MLEFDCGQLKVWRKQRHMKQAEAAERMHCTGATISRWELGLAKITADDLARLASVYDVDDMNRLFVHLINRRRLENG